MRFYCYLFAWFAAVIKLAINSDKPILNDGYYVWLYKLWCNSIQEPSPDDTIYSDRKETEM